MNTPRRVLALSPPCLHTKKRKTDGEYVTRVRTVWEAPQTIQRTKYTSASDYVLVLQRPVFEIF